MAGRAARAPEIGPHVGLGSARDPGGGEDSLIRNLSETLQAMLSDQALGATFPELSKALIAFDRPDDTFKPLQTTIDLFLYDVREDTELASNEPRIERVNGQWSPIRHRSAWRAAILSPRGRSEARI